MSDSIKDISKPDDGNDDDQEAGGGGGVQVEQSGRFRFRSFRKAKKVVLFPIVKAKKQFFHGRNKQQEEENKRVSLSAAAAAANGGANTKGCYFCLKQPLTLESSAESCTSDPNDSSFTYEMLKSFIEKNDFYSKECNSHLD